MNEKDLQVLRHQMTTQDFFRPEDSYNALYSIETVKVAPQGRIDNEFDGIVAKSYDTPSAKNENSTDIAEIDDEKLSLRKRVSKKLGSIATEAKIGYSVHGGPAGMLARGVQKGADKLLTYRSEKQQETDTRAGKMRVALAGVALAGVAAGGMWALNKTYGDHSSLIEAVNQVPTVEADYSHNVVTYRLDPEHTTNLIVGGRGDGTSEGLHGMVKDAPGFEAAHTVKVDYPAQIAPMPGDILTLNESSDVAAQRVYDTLKQNGTDKTHLVMYSQGTQGGMEGLARFLDEAGGTLPPNIEVTVMASPNTPGSGVFHDDLVKEFKPLFEDLGIDMRDADLPDGAEGVTFIANQNDIFANGGEGRNMLRKLGNGANFIAGGDGHSMDGFDDPSRHIVNEIDGNTYVTVKPEGTQNPFLRLAEQHGAYVSQEADAAFEAWMPAGEVGKAAPEVNVDDALDKSVDAVRRVFDDNRIAYDPAHFEIVKNLPVAPEIQQEINNVLNPVIEPAPPAAPAVEAPVPAPQPAVATAPEYVPPAPAPVAPPAPAPVPAPVEQVQQVVDNFVAEHVQPVAPAPVPVPAFEIPTEVVDQVSQAAAPFVPPAQLEQAQNFFNQFTPR